MAGQDLVLASDQLASAGLVPEQGVHCVRLGEAALQGFALPRLARPLEHAKLAPLARRLRFEQGEALALLAAVSLPFAHTETSTLRSTPWSCGPHCKGREWPYHRSSLLLPMPFARTIS